MGIIVLPGELDVPFPRRLFSALAEFQVERGADEDVWRGLVNKFVGGGSMLDIQELSAGELIALKNGVRDLGDFIGDLDIFCGFEAGGVKESLITIHSHLNN